jgi:drug/metabolite transporter (DMT)-like permease
MPQQTAARSTARLWLWAALLALLAGLSVVARARVGTGYHLGDLAALALMASASFVILINQRSMPARAEAED